jgi:hypothetical protein
MRKILNEWRRFLKESKEEDDFDIAGIILQALETGNEGAIEMQDKLRVQKQRAIRILKSVLDDESLAGEVYETDLIYKRDFVVHFMVSTIGEPGVKYFKNQEEFKERAQMALNLIRSNDFEIPTRTSLDFRNLSGSRFSDADHSGGPGDAGLALPNDAFSQEDRSVLDNYIQKWVNFHVAMWGGDEQLIYKTSQELPEALEYFVYLYREYMPHDEKYIHKLKDLSHVLSQTPEPTQEPTRDPYQVAKEEVARLKQEFNELMSLSRQSPKGPKHKEEIESAKRIISTKSKEYRDAKVKMRGLRGR